LESPTTREKLKEKGGREIVCLPENEGGMRTLTLRKEEEE